jgi:glycosyltransferase involved in cell wall biosynthesis
MPSVRLRILPKQSGLISARLAGAEWSTSELIVFLDAHCEATIGWLEPLAQKVKDSNTKLPNFVFESGSIKAKNPICFFSI